MLPELSIFILAYNEEKNIADCVRSAYAAAKSVTKKHEVIVVFYEGSTDRTGEILEKLKKKHKDLRVVVQKKSEKGYGTALRLGIQKSRYKYIFYTDGDNQFKLEDIKILLPFVDKYDIVTGYRKKRNDLIMRRAAARAYNLFVRTCLGTGLRDVDCAFKIYKKEIFDKIKIRCSTGMADAEIIVKAKKQGYKVKEVGVNHYSRKMGSGQFDNKLGLIKPKVVKDLLKDMIKVWRDVHGRKT